jgi:transposase-like protein
MKKKARKYSVDFKQEAVRRMAQATTIVGLAKQLGVRRYPSEQRTCLAASFGVALE